MMQSSAAMRRLPVRIGLPLIVAIIAMLASCAVHSSVRGGSGQDALPALSPSQPVEGVVATQEPDRYMLPLTIGQFLRIVGEGYVDLHLIGPHGDNLQLAREVLSHVVEETGSHLLEITRIRGLTSAQPYEVRVDELLSAAQYAVRQDSLQRDPRVKWLARHAIPLRSVSSDDDDFTDLQPLREAINDARVVLLGEESHANGRVISANARLLRFLHQEMGFDVIAFEAGLYDMWKVWQLILAGSDPADAIPQGLFRIWSHAADFQPLARYIGQQTAGPRPLEVAGVDYQFTGTLSRQGQLVPELRELVAREGLAVEGQELPHGFWTTVGQFRMSAPRDSLPARRDQEDVLSGIRWLAEQVEELAQTRSSEERRELRMWAQVCRSLAEFMAAIWSDARGETPGYERRDRQMARNLAWLAREYFPGRRIIVWAANPHILRYPHRLETRGSEPQPALRYSGMGQHVWEVFGERSFVVAATAYGGQYRWLIGSAGPWTVASDGDASFELEELLAAAGLEYAVLPLRNLPSGGEWLRAPMVSRLPWNYQPILATWPDHSDAVLFLRQSTPRMRRAEPH